MPEKKSVQECKDVVLASVAYANLSIECAEDKKFDWQDAMRIGAKVPELWMKTEAAIRGGGEIPAELADLSEAEVVELVSLVATDLKVGEGKAKRIVGAALKAALYNGLLVKEILSEDDAPSAPAA